MKAPIVLAVLMTAAVFSAPTTFDSDINTTKNVIDASSSQVASIVNPDSFTSYYSILNPMVKEVMREQKRNDDTPKTTQVALNGNPTSDLSFWSYYNMIHPIVKELLKEQKGTQDAPKTAHDNNLTTSKSF